MKKNRGFTPLVEKGLVPKAFSQKTPFSIFNMFISKFSSTNIGHKNARPSFTTGFTLIELLVVISIIGLLSSVVLTSLNTARLKAKDGRRLSDMKQIRMALELYRDANDRYPSPTSGDGDWEESYEDGGQFIETLANNGYLPNPIVDPINNTSYRYSYYRYGAGSSGCPSSRGNFYVIGVRNMETTGNPHPASPGWSCPTRNWQGEFEWVAGAFEH